MKTVLQNLLIFFVFFTLLLIYGCQPSDSILLDEFGNPYDGDNVYMQGDPVSGFIKPDSLGTYLIKDGVTHFVPYIVNNIQAKLMSDTIIFQGNSWNEYRYIPSTGELCGKWTDISCILPTDIKSPAYYDGISLPSESNFGMAGDSCGYSFPDSNDPTTYSQNGPFPDREYRCTSIAPNQEIIVIRADMRTGIYNQFGSQYFYTVALCIE